ncbi:hypothetical protein BSNK01_03980 [Bacillaceae bacterium]
MDMKKVIFFLVDSLIPEILEDGKRHKLIPALQFLIDRGRYWPDCVTVFPTMTASVDSSLLTGTYPDKHGVPGLVWYDPDAKKIIDYGNGWKCVLKLGLYDCAQNVLFRLNEEHLSREVTTIFEDLAQRKRTSASINVIVHRGTKKHRLRVPFLLDLLTGFRLRGELSGPDVVTLGAITETELNAHIPPGLKRGKRMYGINDAYAVEVAKRLLRSDQPPDFLLVYLPDNDHEVHRKSPAHAERALIRVDERIRELLSVFPSWDRALEEYVFIVTSDHGQTRIGKEAEFNIDLDRLLGKFRVLQLGEKVAGHDLVVCNNERMAYLYPLQREKRGEILRTLLAEARIDVIAWKEGRGVRVQEGGSGRELYFEPGGPLADPYGSAWRVCGEYSVLDLQRGQGTIGYGDYPDALNRLYGALYAQDFPTIVITARPRYEFKTKHFPMHLNGGSHGSLHKYDSLVPLLIAGTDEPVKEPPRLIDLKEYILRLLDQPMPSEPEG